MMLSPPAQLAGGLCLQLRHMCFCCWLPGQKHVQPWHVDRSAWWYSGQHSATMVRRVRQHYSAESEGPIFWATTLFASFTHVIADRAVGAVLQWALANQLADR